MWAIQIIYIYIGHLLVVGYTLSICGSMAMALRLKNNSVFVELVILLPEAKNHHLLNMKNVQISIELPSRRTVQE